MLPLLWVLALSDTEATSSLSPACAKVLGSHGPELGGTSSGSCMASRHFGWDPVFFQDIRSMSVHIFHTSRSYTDSLQALRLPSILYSGDVSLG